MVAVDGLTDSVTTAGHGKESDDIRTHAALFPPSGNDTDVPRQEL